MSRNKPPEPFTYSAGGGAGSRLMMVTISTAPMSPRRIRLSASAKLGSKRRLKPIIRIDLFAATTFSVS